MDVLNGMKHLVHSMDESRRVNTFRCDLVATPRSSVASAAASTPRSSVASAAASTPRRSVASASSTPRRSVASASSTSCSTWSAMTEEKFFVLVDSAPTEGGRSREDAEESDPLPDVAVSKVDEASSSEHEMELDSPGDESSDQTSFARDIVFLDTAFDVIRGLMGKWFEFSPFVVDEVRNLIRLVGRDSDVTVLYTTLTSEKHWLLATTPYSEPMCEHALFGTIKYVIRCPLDRMIYAILVGQSLTVLYNTYQQAVSLDRARRLSPLVSLLERLRDRHCCGENSPIADDSYTHELRRIIFFVGQNASFFLRETLRLGLALCDFDRLVDAVDAWTAETNRFLKGVVTTLQKTKAHFETNAAPVSLEKLSAEKPAEKPAEKSPPSRDNGGRNGRRPPRGSPDTTTTKRKRS